MTPLAIFRIRFRPLKDRGHHLDGQYGSSLERTFDGRNGYRTFIAAEKAGAGAGCFKTFIPMARNSGCEVDDPGHCASGCSK